MEDLVSFIASIPLLFSYFIPGYVYIWVRRHLNNGKKIEGWEMLFASVVITFILNLVITMSFDIFHLRAVMSKSLGFNSVYTYSNLMAVLFAAICGYLSCRLNKSKLVLWSKEKLGLSVTAYPTVWDAALEEPAWVRVYLDGLNICYMGRVRFVLSDPDTGDKELYMTQYKTYATNDDMKELVNYSSDKEGIYLNCKDVSRIEVSNDRERVF